MGRAKETVFTELCKGLITGKKERWSKLKYEWH